MERVTVISLGGWGIALACLLNRNGRKVRIWGRSKEKTAEVASSRFHPEYLPGIRLDENIEITSDVEAACSDTSVFISATPSKGARDIFKLFAPHIKNGSIVANAAKGFEEASLLRMSEVMEELLPACKIAAISGPGHAEEVALGLPTAYAVAAKDVQVAEKLQDMMNSPVFRVYVNHDLIGLEIGGALKNVIALAAGISDGVGYGDNAKAALMTRGLVEIARLGVAMGADEKTFVGLSGIGDLIVTCTSMHSRNRRCGILIGQGKSAAEAEAEIHMTVEGVVTAKTAYRLAAAYGVEMPITEAIHQILEGRLDPKAAVNRLMGRGKGREVKSQAT